MYRSIGDPKHEQRMFRYAKQVQTYLAESLPAGSYSATKMKFKKHQPASQ